MLFRIKRRQWSGASASFILLCACGVGHVGAAPQFQDDSDCTENCSEESSDESLFMDLDLLVDEEAFSESESGYEEKLLFGGNRKFIFQHDYAYVLSDPKQVASNRSSLRFQWNRVLKDILYLHVDVKPIAYFNGDDVLEDGDSVDSSFKNKELYAKASLGDTTITIGEKIIVWGESESSAVTDVISPQNITDLVFTSLDESRLAQTMLVIEQYVKQNQFTLIINPNIRFDQDPAVAAGESEYTALGRKVDDKDVEVGFRWQSVIGSGDFSIMLADLIDNGSVEQYIPDADGAISGVHDYYKNYQMLGAAANLNLGEVSLQMEAVFNKDRAQQLSSSQYTAQKYSEGYGVSDEFVASFNLDYQENGLRDWSAGFKHTRLFEDTDDFALNERMLNEIFLGVSNKLFFEQVTLSLEYQYEIETEASIGQLSTQYQAADNLTLSLDVFNLDNQGGGQFAQTSAIARVIYSF